MSANADRSPYTRDWLTQALARPAPPTNRASLSLITPEKKPMSYSIGVRAATVALALAALATKFDEEVVKNQPVHAKDRDMALKVAELTLESAVVPEGQDLTVSLNGSIWVDGEHTKSQSVGASYGFVPKPVEPAAQA